MTEAKIFRLLCDEMLGRLARWLRAAGHDVAVAEPGSSDAALVEVAGAEDRLLLTRDRRILERRAAAGRVLVLEHGTLAAQAGELRRRLGLDWTAAPFTRCLVDNALLGEAAGSAPPYRHVAPPLRRCPQCGRLYWPGGHVRRMRARLDQWSGTAGGQLASDADLADSSGLHRGGNGPDVQEGEESGT